jgi:energy-coupling factor transporter ATP-binding protein EcfA2
MFCLEDRITRELYWAGFGFQVWCQILTHIVRERDSTLLVIDEPEIYLHPDLQRQLLAILRELGPDIILATHSSEMVSDADPQELLMVDKRRQSAQRLTGERGTQAALLALGSAHNVALTQLARTRRVLYVEGDDFRLLRMFARRLGYVRLAAGTDFAIFSLGGFPSAERVRAACYGIRQSIGADVRFAGTFDRDYRSEDEAQSARESFSSDLDPACIWRRKEIENYLLVPSALDRAMARALEDRAARTGAIVEQVSSAAELLEEITAPMRTAVNSNYVGKRIDYFRHSVLDSSTIASRATELVDEAWIDLRMRMEIVPGSDVLAALNARLQALYDVQLSPRLIIDSMHVSEIPTDLRELLARLEAFCLARR